MKLRFLRNAKTKEGKHRIGDVANVKDDKKAAWLVATGRAYEVPDTSSRVETASLETGRTAARPRPKRKRSKD